MQITCPCCHARFALEAALESEDAAKRVVLLVKMKAGRSLLAYLAFFRPRKQALPWHRSLRLAEEVGALAVECGGGDERWKNLANALNITVDAMHQKGGLPLKSHGYFKKVMQRCAQSPSAGDSTFAPLRSERPQPIKPQSKTEQGVKGFFDAT